MNEKEQYYSFTKHNNIHILSDRMPFNWKEVLIFTVTSFTFLIWFMGFLIGIYIFLLTQLGYILYRFSSSIYYTEIHFNEKTKRMVKLKKLFNSVKNSELIANSFDNNNFDFIELTRSGKTKYVLNYKTHKNNELLIIKNIDDKKQIENYIINNFTFSNAT